jgi:DNA-nicking Smr family endonuclease
VARTVTPLAGRGRGVPPEEPERQPPEAAREAPAPAREPPREGAARVPVRHALDLATRKKLSKGRIPIEGVVDLHGLRQSEAHLLLLSFLHRAHADGRRHVLVVTGKGSSLGSEGVLRRAVPAWLATPPFRALVSAHESAARNHGGAGALYVRLRRQGDGTGG